MRLGRKLSEGFAVDHEADAAAPEPVVDRATPVAESEGHAGSVPEPVASGRTSTS